MKKELLNILKQSYLSFVLLKEIMNDVSIISLPNNVIYIENIPLLDEKNRKLLIFTMESKKLRRRYKKKYIYFNAFKNKEHFNIILDKFYENNENISNIEIEDMKNYKVLLLKDNFNKVLDRKIIKDNNLSYEEIIINYLLQRYEIL